MPSSLSTLFAEPGNHGEKSLRGVRELDETSGAILSQGDRGECMELSAVDLIRCQRYKPPNAHEPKGVRIDEEDIAPPISTLQVGAPAALDTYGETKTPRSCARRTVTPSEKSMGSVSLCLWGRA